MNDISRTDWKAFDAITEEEALAGAMTDADNPPGPAGAVINLRPEDGETVLSRFRKALERETKVSLTVRYDADVVRWYKAKGKGYQAVMNAALRSVMEAEQAAAHGA